MKEENDLAYGRKARMSQAALRSILGMDAREPYLFHNSLAEAEPEFFAGDTYAQGKRPVRDIILERRQQCS